MTFYWWTHWFWITLFGFALIDCSPLGSVDTFSSKSSNKNEENGNKSTYLKRGGEKFLLMPPTGIPAPISTQVSTLPTSGTLATRPNHFETFDDAVDSEDEVVGVSGLDADFTLGVGSHEIHNTNISLPISTTTVSTNSNLTTIVNMSATTDVISANFTRLNKNDTIFVRNSQNITTLKLKNLQNKEVKDLKTGKIPDKGTRLIDKLLEAGETIDNVTSSASPTVESNLETQANSSVTNNITEPAEYDTTAPTVESEVTTTAPEQPSSVNYNNLGRTGKILSSEFRDIDFVHRQPNASSYISKAVAFNLQEGIDDNDHPLEDDDYTRSSRTRLNVGAISGICLASLAVLSGISVTLIILYRRYIYLNKPQTLSEPDSSGYIDDSTIRDNSDEMYSLDNDSFLNSLEAMTIQNYWTDNVKHTKL